WNPGNRRSDHGNPAAHRLQEHVGNPIAIPVTGHHTRERKNRSSLVSTADHVMGLRTHEPHPVIQTELRHLVFKSLMLRAVAYNLHLEAPAPPPQNAGGHD